jgi:transcription elongation factor GreA
MLDKYPISAIGRKLLDKELTRLREEIPVILQEVVIARSKGDFSENFELYAAKKQLDQTRNRIDLLEKYLRSTQICAIPANPQTPQFASKVVFMRDQERCEYVILGDRESEPSIGTLSCASPLFTRLVGKKPNDVFDFNGAKYTLLEVHRVEEKELEELVRKCFQMKEDGLVFKRDSATPS